MSSSGHKVYAASLKDKFGEFGIIGVIILQNEKEFWFIDTFLLSCRAMSRGVEKMFLRQAINDLRNNPVVQGEYIKTPKNSVVENLYKDFGFMNQDGKWIFDSKKKEIENVEWIRVNFNG